MRSTHEIIPKPIPLPNPEPHPRSNRRSLRKLRTAVVKRRRQRLGGRGLSPPPQEVEPMCEPPGSRQGGDARGGPCERSSHHRRRAASREARGAMRGTGQPLCSQTRTATCCSTCAVLSSCGFCCSSTLCLGFRTCACTFDPQIRLLGWWPLTRPGLDRTWFTPPAGLEVWRRAAPARLGAHAAQDVAGQASDQSP